MEIYRQFKEIEKDTPSYKEPTKYNAYKDNMGEKVISIERYLIDSENKRKLLKVVLKNLINMMPTKTGQIK